MMEKEPTLLGVRLSDWQAFGLFAAWFITICIGGAATFYWLFL